ncbi:MAG: PilZ domain-containing protein [Spirochaetia bacterium]
MAVEITRIEKEFIFKNLIDGDTDISLHYERREYQAKITDYNEDIVEIQLSDNRGDEFDVEGKINAFFKFYGHVMTFKSTVVKIKNKSAIHVKYPDGIYKNLERKYERVPLPVNMEVSFHSKGDTVDLDFPKSNEYDPVEEPEVSGDFEVAQLGELVTNFRERFKDEAQVNTIVMFRERKPTGFEEEITSKTGKILYLPIVEDGFPIEDPFILDPRVLTRLMVREYLEDRGMDADQAENAIKQFKERKKRNNISAEIIAPILYHQYVVGYCYLANKKNGSFNKDILETVMSFSKILAYALKVNGYFKTSGEEEKQYRPQILDISASGLFFGYPSQELDENLQLYTDIKVVIRIGKREMHINSRIVRKFQGRGVNFYGVQFMDIRPEDFRYLFETLYGRSFQEEDEKKWEGGAKPPSPDI